METRDEWPRWGDEEAERPAAADRRSSQVIRLRSRRRPAAHRGRNAALAGLTLAAALAALLWLAVGPKPGAEPAPGAGSQRVVADEPESAANRPATPTDPARADPLLAALARLDPTGRIDDRTADLAYWPIVAPDPERGADSGSQPQTPPGPGSYEVHVVAVGETLLGIAIDLGVDPDQLADLNHIADKDRLAVGQRLLVPPSKGDQQRAMLSSRGAALRPRFAWPHRGNVTTYYGERGSVWIGGYHTGLDIAGQTGDPVLAAEAGTVLDAGWSDARGFGNFVLLDHGLGYRTLYGHLSEIRVKVGQEVTRGELIGNVGSTGVSTGPHLHFEIRLDGRPVDPLAYLP